ncbi:ankyrin repeat domain-containing protein [Marinobacter confluentis]|uniref:Ankyrin repeat domain-containing protein n=1 Tax=Marinobacter confluentis TaxID=1697557 RepID=A0A4Z1C7K1_9GAMM|nr:ankyrin repeat domain-containing protein [Marinobacter confluentis]TGN39385.1 ankyrin repeat domain-containing protein [Marinobacter confluentis]
MSNHRSGKPENPGNKQDEDAVAFLQGLFELARNGGTGPLNVMLDAGVPVDIRTSAGDSLLMLACRNGHKDTAEMLLERGADPNACNHQSETPLMVATIAEHTELVDCLLEAGAEQ